MVGGEAVTNKEYVHWLIVANEGAAVKPTRTEILRELDKQLFPKLRHRAATDSQKRAVSFKAHQAKPTGRNA